MKTQLLFLAVFFSFNAFTQAIIPSDWSSVVRVAHGGTNEVNSLKLDNEGNIYYSGSGSQINPGNSHALIVGKRDANLQIVWQKNYEGVPDDDKQSLLVDENNIYIASRFNWMNFPTDTFPSDGAFLVCLDASNGDFKWVKDLGYKGDMKLAFDGNNDLVLATVTSYGVQYYDNQPLDTLLFTMPSVHRGYGYITIDKTDGSVINHAFGLNNLVGNVLNNTIVGRKVISLITDNTSTLNPINLNLVELNLDDNTVTDLSRAINLSGPDSYYKLLNTLYHPTDKSWTVFLEHSVNSPNQSIYFGADTLNIPIVPNVYSFSSAVHLDSNLNIENYVTYNSTILPNNFQASPTSNDTTLLFSFGADGDGYVLKNGVLDTIKFTGAVTQALPWQRGYFIARCNFNFENFVYTRFSVRDDNAGWHTGMELKSVELADNGNFYGVAFHENDIIALPDTIPAYNKSWKHLSVIAKYETDGQTTSIENNSQSVTKRLAIYPNPTSNRLHISTSGLLEELKIIDVSGRLVLSDNKNTIDVSSLKNGMYYLHIKTDRQTYTSKFLKQ